MNPHKCPVCNGNGIVAGGFYSQTSGICISDEVTEPCQSCNGTGIVWKKTTMKDKTIESIKCKNARMKYIPVESCAGCEHSVFLGGKWWECWIGHRLIRDVSTYAENGTIHPDCELDDLEVKR